MILDRKGNIVFINRKLKDLTRYFKLNFIGKNIASIKLLTSKSKLIVAKNFLKRISGKKVEPYEIEIIAKNNETIIAEVNASPIIKSGKIIGELAILRDITELKRTHLDLMKSKEILEKTFASLDSAIFILDGSNPPKIVELNNKAVEIFGYSKNKMLGKSTEFLHVDKNHLKTFQKALYPEIKKNGKLIDYKFEMKRSNGAVFATNHSVMPIFDEEKKKIGWTSIVNEVTKKDQRDDIIKNSLKNSPIGISIARKRKIIWANNKFCKITGYKDNEIINKNVSFLYPSKKEYDIVGKKLYSQIKKSNIGSLVTKIKKKNKLIIDVLLNASALEGNDASEEVIVTIFDLTRDKKIKEQVAESKKQIEKYLNLIGNIVISLNVNGDIMTINKAGCDILGYLEKELIGKNWFEICLPENIKTQNQKIFINSIKNKKIINDKYENSILNKNGETRYFSWNNTLLKDKKGKITGLLSSGTDITERKNYEDKIKESKKQLHDFFENANEIIQSVNTKGRFIYVNKKWSELLGYNPEEAKNMKFTEVLRKDQINHCLNIFQGLSSGKSFENIETVMIAKDKKEIFVTGNISSKSTAGKFEYTIGIFHDVTQKKKIENYENKHLEELQSMNRLMINRELKMIELKKEIKKLNDIINSKKT